MTANAQDAQTTQTRPLVTIGATDVTHKMGQIMAGLARGHVYRIVDFRTRVVRGYLCPEPPPDLAAVAADGIDGYLARLPGGPASRHCSRCQGTHPSRAACPQPRPPATSKRCPGCGQDKPASEFYPAPSRYDGLDSHCRPCRLELASAARSGDAHGKPLSVRAHANGHSGGAR